VKPFIVPYVYRPPNSAQAWINLFEKQFINAVNNIEEIYILGDIHIGGSLELQSSLRKFKQTLDNKNGPISYEY